MQIDKQFKKVKILFKAIDKEKTHIKAKSKAYANLAKTRSYSKLLRRVAFKKKKKFVK